MFKTISKKTVYWLIATILVLYPIIAFSVANTVSLQGYLTDSDGNPKNGSFYLTFKIYAFPYGGSVIWEDKQTIPVKNGFINVTLNNLSYSDVNGNRYLGVAIEGDEEMSPRYQLNSVPSSIVSGTTESVDSSALATKSEAESGNSISKIMTPKRTKEAIASTTIHWNKISNVPSAVKTLQNLASVLTAGNDAGGKLIRNIGHPQSSTDAATKQYVDNWLHPGAVMAFDLDYCPAGWSPMSQLYGRVLVAAGQGAGLTNRIKGKSGGSETVTLEIPHLPPHDHGFSYYSAEQFDSKDDGTNNDKGFNRRKAQYSGTTEKTGEGKAHENMPPYYVLTFCRKN